MTRPKLAALAALLLLPACSFWMPHPWRLDLSIDRFEVVELPRAKLFGGGAGSRDDMVRALRLDLSSPEDPLRYFGGAFDGSCRIEGAKDERSYVGATLGPYHDGNDMSLLRSDQANTETRSSPSPDGRFRYTIFTFIDLRSPDATLEAGRIRGWLNMTTQRFDSISCVLMRPQIFGIVPRSHEATISYAQFSAALSAFESQQPLR